MQKRTQQIILLAALGLVSVTHLQAQSKKAKLDSVRNIDEVVVTALGIKRQDKSLGYVAEKVSSEEFEKTQNNNWAQALEGKSVRNKKNMYPAQKHIYVKTYR